MTSPEMQADLMNYLFAAAAATVTGVALNVACTIGHRENQRGKKDKSMRSQRGKKGGSQRSARGKKKGGSQRSLRKKKNPPVGGAPAAGGAPVAASKEPVKKSEQDKSARSKGGDKSARSKKQDGSNRGKKDASKKSQKNKKSTAKKESSKREKKPDAPPKDEEKEPTTAVLPPTPEAPLVPESPVVPPETPPSAPPAAPVSQVSEPPKEAIETNNGIVTPDRPDSVMVDLCGGPGAGNPGDKSHRIYGTAGEAAVAEAKRQAELDRMKPKEQLDPGQSQYMK